MLRVVLECCTCLRVGFLEPALGQVCTRAHPRNQRVRGLELLEFRELPVNVAPLLVVEGQSRADAPRISEIRQTRLDMAQDPLGLVPSSAFRFELGDAYPNVGVLRVLETQVSCLCERLDARSDLAIHLHQGTEDQRVVFAVPVAELGLERFDED